MKFCVSGRDAVDFRNQESRSRMGQLGGLLRDAEVRSKIGVHIFARVIGGEIFSSTDYTDWIKLSKIGLAVRRKRGGQTT